VVELVVHDHVPHPFGGENGRCRGILDIARENADRLLARLTDSRSEQRKERLIRQPGAVVLIAGQPEGNAAVSRHRVMRNDVVWLRREPPVIRRSGFGERGRDSARKELDHHDHREQPDE
jgi:hypothetical protein